MKDLRTYLRQGDPLVREAGLSPAEIDRIRSHVLTAKREAVSRLDAVFVALAATLLLAITGGVLLTRAPLPASGPVEPSAAAPSDVTTKSTLRQLQFSAPGGTRVIWTFNPNFEVR